MPDPNEKGDDVTLSRELQVEGNETSGYVGVSPEYQNYANETEKPHTVRGEFKIDNDTPEAAVVKQPDHPQMRGSDAEVKKARAAQKANDDSSSSSADDAAPGVNTEQKDEKPPAAPKAPAK